MSTLEDYEVHMEKTQGQSADDVYWESHEYVANLLEEIEQLKADLAKRGTLKNVVSSQLEKARAERNKLRANKKAIEVLLHMNEDLIPADMLRAVIREIRKHL